MYGVTEHTQDLTSGGGAIAPGINENVTVQVVFEKLKEDSPSMLLMVNYTDASGNTLRDIIWPIDAQSEVERNRANRFSLKRQMTAWDGTVIPKGPLADEHVVLRAHTLLGQKLFHIGAAMSDEATAKTTVKGPEYADVARQLIELNQAAAGKKYRLKVILNNKDYSDVPKYGSFLEPMSVENTNLKIGTSDRIEKTTPQDSAVASVAPGMDVPDMPPVDEAPPIPGV